MLFRIFTENVNKDGIADITSKQFDGFTMLEGVGYWKGERENSLVVEIVAPDTRDSHERVNTIAREIKQANKQQAVLLQTIANDSYFI